MIISFVVFCMLLAGGIAGFLFILEDVKAEIKYKNN